VINDDVGETKSPAPNQRGTWARKCGGQYGVVPVHVLKDKSLKEGPKVLFALLCGYADGSTDVATRSNALLAQDLNVHERSIIRWMRDLELGRHVMKLTGERFLGKYRVIRNPADRDDANWNLLLRLIDRQQFAKHGRNGNVKDGDHLMTPESPDEEPADANQVTPESPDESADIGDQVTPESPACDTAVSRSGDTSATHSRVYQESSQGNGDFKQLNEAIAGSTRSLGSERAGSASRQEANATKDLADEIGWLALMNMDEVERSRLVAERVAAEANKASRQDSEGE